MGMTCSRRCLAGRVRAFLVAALVLAASAGAAPDRPERPLFLVGVPDGASWQDFAYLAAVPAATHRSARKPSVVALPPTGEIGRELADYLARYRPGEVFALGIAAGAKPPAGLKWKVLAADSADAAACELATRFWEKCARAVVCREDDYAS
ncbi:MAG: hypothetical protein ACYTFI_11440, partial [Planctomycetota bacterium]